MGQVQEQRYVCKICSKSCVSGKSLGGHMRVHSALVAASKRLPKEKSEIEIQTEEQTDDQESCRDQSNSEEEKTETGDGDQSSSYGLRENPKKSWRISGPKNRGGVSKIRASCKECSKDFPSLRALSGHMRSHSVKNKKLHKCKTCGKGFDSMRAMFGHMKSHSTKSKARDDESLSDLDDLCPIRRKRSRIRYKSAPSASLSGLNESTSAVSELEDVEEVAKCLMMLSRGELNGVKVDFVSESSDDCSEYFGANSAGDDDGDFDGKMKLVLSPGNVDDCVSDSVTAFAEKNVSEFDDLGSMFAAHDHEKEVDLDAPKDGLPSVCKTVKHRQENEFCVKLDCVDDSRHVQGGNSPMDDSIKLHFAESGNQSFELNCQDSLLEQERAGMGNATVCLSKSKEHECSICFKVFASGQALGGHKRAHYNGSNESKSKESMGMNQEVASVCNLLDLNYPITDDEGAKGDVGLNLWRADRSCEHDALVLTN